MKRLLAIILILGLAMPVMAKKHQSEEIITPLTQLEKRSFQTRTYKAKDQNVILKSILNVLQDEGYIIYNVNSLLGFAYAVKDFDTTDPNIDISKEFGLTKSRLSYNGVKVATLESCANVTQYGETIRVRINFKRKLLNEYGNAQFIDDVSDAEFYNEFYEKLDQAIALHKELNTPKIVPVKDTSTPSEKPKDVIITPDLMKEINDNIEKIINTDAPKIPEISEQKQENTEIKKEPANEDTKIEKTSTKEEIKPQKNEEKTDEINQETSKKDKKIKEKDEKTPEVSKENDSENIKNEKAEQKETKKVKQNKKEQKEEDENNK